MREKSEESNFIRHWVRIRLEGFKPERLISQMMEKGAALRGITYVDETEVCLTLSEEDLRLMKKLAGSRYKFTVLQEGGSRPAIRRLKKSRLTAAGVVLFVIVTASQMLFVREINIIGLSGITEDSLRQTLKEEGLYEGGVKRFDANAIEKTLFKKYRSIVWARISYEGNYVEVEVAESRQKPMTEENRKKPCHIVAENDCYVEEILTYRGRRVASEGEFVKKGGILISGTVPLEHPSFQLEKDETGIHYVHAEGKVTARVPYYFSFYMEPAPSKLRRAAAETEVRAWIKENVPENAQILNKDFHFASKKNIIRVYGTIETRQPVGIEKEIVIDKQKRRTKTGTD